jgi:hypothetical protein
MKIQNVIPFPPRPKPAPVVPIVGRVGEGGRVTFFRPGPRQ